MLDHHDRVTGLDQALQHDQQAAGVLEVQAGGRLVEQVHRVAGRALGQLGGQLHPLGFTTRQRGGRLAEAHVAEPDVDQRLQVTGDHRLGPEELEGLIDRQVEHFGDVLALVANLEGVAVVSGPAAHLARHVHVGQKVHLDLQRAVAGAGLAAAALDVEAEPAGQVAAHLRFGGAGEQLADVVEHARVGSRVGTWGPPDRRLVDVDHLVDVLEALHLAVQAGRHLGVVDVLHQRAHEDVVDQAGFTRPGHAGDAHERAERNADGEVLQVVFAGADDAQPAIARGAAPVGHFDRHLLGQVLPGQACLGLQQALDRAGVHHLAAVLAGARADVDHVVGSPDRVLVVFDDDHRVAQAAQALEGFDQPVVVALVQADRRLVEHVQHADQAGADLAGQADALGLATRQGGGATVQVEVVEAHVDQKAQAGVDLLQHALGDQQLAFVQLHGDQPVGRVGDRHRRQVVHVEAVDRHRQRQRVQPGTAAVRAGHLAHVALGLLAGPVAVRLAVAAAQVGNGPLEVGLVATGASVAVLEPDAHLLARAVQQRLAVLGGQVLPRGIEVDASLLAHRLEQPVEELGVTGRPRGDRALGHRQLRVGHHQVGVHLEGRAQAVAVLAGAVGRVEREVAGRQFLETLAVGRTGQLFGEGQRLRLALLGHQLDLGDALAEAQRCLHRVGQPAVDALA